MRSMFARRVERRNSVRVAQHSLLGLSKKQLDEEESSVDVIDRINAVVDAVKDDTREFTSTAARRVLAKDDNAKW